MSRRTPPLCGAVPYCGSWDSWCELPAGHDGLHEGDGGAFSLASRKRHVRDGALVAGPPPRRAGRR